MKFDIRTAGDINEILAAASRIKIIARSQGSLKKRILATLEEKNGEYRLWRDLIKLVDFAWQLNFAPCEVHIDE